MITGKDLNNVSYEAVRRYKDLDLIFVNQVLDPLDDAYYNNWKVGNRKVWFGFNIHPKDTPEEAKLLFDQLQILVHSAYEVVLQLLANELGVTISWGGEEMIDPDYDEDVDPGEPPMIMKGELSKRNLRRLRDIQNVSIDQIKNFVEAQFGIVFEVGS